MVNGQFHTLAMLHMGYTFDRRMGGPQSQSGCSGEKEKPLHLPGIEP